MALKICTRCTNPKPLSEFWVSRVGRTRDGLKGECKDCAKARRRTWAAENRDREREWNRAKYLADPQRYIASNRQWKLDHPECAREIRRMTESARRARKHNQFIENVDPAVVYIMHGGMCGICNEFVSKDEFHVDHVIPLARGGMHGYVNVQPAHAFCNLSKGARV